MIGLLLALCIPAADYADCPLPTAAASPTPSYVWTPGVEWASRHAVVGVILKATSVELGYSQVVEVSCQFVTLERPDRTITRWSCPGIRQIGEECLSRRAGLALQRYFEWPEGAEVLFWVQLRYVGPGERLSTFGPARTLCWPLTVTVGGDGSLAPN